MLGNIMDYHDEYESLIRPEKFFEGWSLEEFSVWCLMAETQDDLWALYVELQSANMIVHSQIVLNILQGKRVVLDYPFPPEQYFC